MIQPVTMIQRLAFLSSLLVGLLPGVVQATGQVYTVNTFAAGEQFDATISRTTDGSFLVVWRSFGQDGDQNGIFGRKLNAAGEPVGAEIAINTVTAGDQTDPALATLSDGRFIVVWRGADAADLRGRVLQADGSPAGPELVLSSLAPQYYPTILADGDGFVAVWSDSEALYFQAFDNDGAARGPATEIAEAPVITSSVYPGGPSITALDSGQYYVVWQSDERVWAHRLENDGSPLGGPFRLDPEERRQTVPVIAARPGLAFAVWAVDQDALYVRGLANDGTFLSPPARIPEPSDYPTSASVSATASGFRVAYPRHDSNDHHQARILGQDFDNGGRPVGVPFRMSLDVGMFAGPAFDLRYRYQHSKTATTLDGGILVLFVDDPDSWDVTVRRLPGFWIDAPVRQPQCENTPIESEVPVRSLGSVDPVFLDLPDRPDFTIAPNPVTPTGTAVVSTPPLPVPPVTHVFRITGDDGSSTDAAVASFWVFRDDPPPTLTIFSPADGAQEAPIAPELDWTIQGPVSLLTTWTAELYRDAALTELVERGTPIWDYRTPPYNHLEYQTQVLEPGVEYFWRVRSENPCGPAEWVNGSFRTAPDFVLAQETLETGQFLDIFTTLEGTPDVAPAASPGTFVVAYPGYTYVYYNESYSFERKAEVEILGQAGSPASRGSALTFPDQPFGGPDETDLETPVAGSVSQGEFVVIWGGTEEVVSQRMAVDGSKVGDDQPLGTSPERLTYPAAATDSTGGQAVVWADREGSPRISGRLLADDGSPIGEAFQVSSGGAAVPDRPAVAWSPSPQEFMVVWESYGSPGNDGDGWSIVGRRLGSDGSLPGAEFQVNSFTSGDQRNPELVPVVGGDGFLVVWQSQGSAGSDNDGWSIQGRYVTPDGPRGSDFQLNSYTPGAQRNPDVALEPNWGGLLATWQSRGSFGDDSSEWSIQARRLTPDLELLEPEFQVNSLTAGDQFGVRVAAHPESRDFLVVWRDEERILGARIDGEVFFFTDGFESGDLSAWQ